MLNIVPVCGGGSDFMVEGSTCGLAGRRLRRMIFLVFLAASSSTVEVCVELVVTRSVEAKST